MKISDILRDYADTLMLRSIADKIDNQEQNAPVNAIPVTANTLPTAQGQDTPPINQPNDKFLPPLQLKLELLKKASGIESVYDEETEEDVEEEDFEVVLQQLRKNAGLKPAIMGELTDNQLDI